MWNADRFHRAELVVLSGSRNERAPLQAMENVSRRLVSRAYRLIQLLDHPSTSRTSKSAVNKGASVPGCAKMAASNATGIWAVMACARW